MKKLSIGLAGCGATSWMFAPCFRFLEEGQLVAAMDPSVSALASIQKQVPGIRTYTTYTDLIADDQIDAVLIGSPVAFHEEQVIQAAHHGKHVLCEKPMAPTVDACDRMLEACKRAGVLLMVALFKRFHPSMLFAYDMIQKGDLGKIFQVTTNWSWAQYFLAGWRDQFAATGGGLFLDHGSHTVDLCRWWLGDIETASAEINILLEGREVEDQVAATYRHHNGAVSVHLQTRMTHTPLVERYQIDGTSGCLILECKGWSGPLRKPFDILHYHDGYVDKTTIETIPQAYKWTPDDDFDQNDAYLAELRHFCRAVHGDETLKVTGMDGRKAIEAINAAYLSSWKKEKIHLPLQSAGDLEICFKESRKYIATNR